ncbi:MAG: hypothetical protein IRZ03_18565, partial [Acidobacterium ailaaui]|nr:hypothetical protein [Pseudacidobacterium ailaaui]
MMKLKRRNASASQSVVNYMTVDIETAKDSAYGSTLLGDAVYISWCENGEGYGIAESDLTRWLLERFLIPEKNEWILYAHNGFGFDFKRIDFSCLVCHGFRIRFIAANGGYIKGATIERGDCVWYLRDSFLLINVNLKKLTKTFAPEFVKHERDDFEQRAFDVTNPDDV